MYKITKIIIRVVIILFLPIFILRLSHTVLAAQPVPDFRLIITLNHTSDYTLTLNKIGLEAGPYVNYGLNYTSNFYFIKIIDKNNTELFSGKILKSYQTLPPDFVPVTNFTPEIIIADPINLFLPYFNEAAKVQLFDENNVLKLEIVLANYNLQGLKYRYAACDLCGYCPPAKPPSNWEKCRLCLYPKANKDPLSNETLIISDPASNKGPTPVPSKAFIGVGCIDSSPSKATQSFLNIIFSISGGIAFLVLLYGAFVMATSHADPERLNYGRRLIRRAVIGLILTLLSIFIVNFIAYRVLKIPEFN
ncbi:hypothetical protein A2954_01120 [Candidatus Roizmanbacteria bacterium RIFCSPLOWO2_01_FULL_37_12]|uniref:Uncharacterized protein n=1 Tax=Candidatus Roizmanbacteria bacterium RIFCSPLOWO2_01_FULL_37_12 TaxID=1802056 RepID=A0A1F7IGD7_9BACT|nr:MAG: hypothetical protein A3D76_01725 [Candidatus Roizmanbacteria bacterium RIFCSPHIGHO2_02_FULL_37_9b]OGK42427.1 MAG: hypothetical protein A2954_01120 [Candidatus Roizmanbacteria bacterium RIFCSPLOWO2_01_FULL_37_12]